MRNYILLFVYGFSYLLYYNLYSNYMYLMRNGDEDSKGNSKQLDSSEVNSYPEPEQDPNSGPEQDPNSGPEQDPNEDDFIQKSVNNNNLITIEHKHKLSTKYLLNLSNLNYSTASPIYNFLKDKNTLLKNIEIKVVFTLYIII